MVLNNQSACDIGQFVLFWADFFQWYSTVAQLFKAEWGDTRLNQLL